MIQISDKNLKEAAKLLSGVENGVEKALSRALNHSISKAKTSVKRKATADYYIKSADIEKTLKVRKAHISNLEATITSKGPILALNKFKVKNSAGGVQAAVSKLQGYRVRKHAFVRRVANFTGHDGNKATFSQTDFSSRVFKRKNSGRMPIVEQSGASVPGMLGSKTVMGYAEELIVTETEKRLLHEVGRILGGFK